MSQDRRCYRIGTRASKLARWQSDWTASQLTALGIAVDVVEISTRGDVDQTGAVTAIGATGVFTKEIQTLLLAGEVDIAVHSLKDLPTGQVAGLTLAATPPRETIADSLVTSLADSLDGLPQGAKVGTGSLRRQAQLLHLRPDLRVEGIRGNVDTRLCKLDAREYDAIILAAAGLTRLGWASRITERLEPPRMLPAPGQGALALECRADDREAFALLAKLDDGPTRLATTAERAVLAALHGGCSAPVAAWGRMVDDRLLVDALVAELDGRRVLRANGEIALPLSSDDREAIVLAERLGRQLAEWLLEQGAADVIRAARGA